MSAQGEAIAVDDLPTIPVEKLTGSITKDTNPPLVIAGNGAINLRLRDFTW